MATRLYGWAELPSKYCSSALQAQGMFLWHLADLLPRLVFRLVVHMLGV